MPASPVANPPRRRAGVGKLWLAILADTGATLLVILNSLRLLQGNRD